jgi:aldehyde dehydrogenase (NAD+)
MHHRQLYIDGRWVASVSGDLMEVISPVTEQPIVTVAMGNEQDIDRAARAARAAFASYTIRSAT